MERRDKDIDRNKPKGEFDEGNEHKFWSTQPVPQTAPVGVIEENCPIEPSVKVEGVRQEPYNLPKNFEWAVIDIFDTKQAQDVYTLLYNNYVEDDEAQFRFDYSIPLLQWAICPPGYNKNWLIGVRGKSNGVLYGFIAGIPEQLSIRGKVVHSAVIDFLCVHKGLRSKGLAPVLIQEITRRVHLTDGWQAIYTSGTLLPQPVANTRYWHRSLNPRKLVDIGFSHIGPRMTMKRMDKLFNLPSSPVTPGFRQIESKDIAQAYELLMTYFRKFPLHFEFTFEEFQYYFTPVKDVIDAYVVEDLESHKIIALTSFFYLPSSIIGNKKYTHFKAAYSFYNVVAPESGLSLCDLMKNSLIIAKKFDTDVFNALDVMDNPSIFSELKFCIGDGHLHYYLYNWKTKLFASNEIATVLV